MSSKPHPEGAAEVIAILDEMHALETQIVRDAPIVDERVARLQKQRERYATLNADLAKRLRSMDVESPGNYGWEARFGWLLAEVLRQVRRVPNAG